MANKAGFAAANLLAERKERLLNEAAAYRLAIVSAKKSVTVERGSDLLTQFALEQGLNFARSGLGSLLVNGRVLQTLMPLLAGGVSLLSATALIKPLIKGILMTAAIACAVRYFKTKAEQNRRPLNAS